MGDHNEFVEVSAFMRGLLYASGFTIVAAIMVGLGYLVMR